MRWWCESTFVKLNLQGSAILFSGYHTDICHSNWILRIFKNQSGEGMLWLYYVFLLFPPESQDDQDDITVVLSVFQSSLQIDSGTLKSGLLVKKKKIPQIVRLWVLQHYVEEKEILLAKDYVLSPPYLQHIAGDISYSVSIWQS